MSDPTITDKIKQTVITRLATINSATSILSLLNGRPAKVTVDEVLALAERIEGWAWRELLEEPPAARPPDRPAEPARTEPAAGRGPTRPQANGSGQRPGEASERQIAAIFAIGRSKGYSPDELKGVITQKLGKHVNALTSREASQLIDDLRVL